MEISTLQSRHNATMIFFLRCAPAVAQSYSISNLFISRMPAYLNSGRRNGGVELCDKNTRLPAGLGRPRRNIFMAGEGMREAVPLGDRHRGREREAGEREREERGGERERNSRLN